MIQLKVPISDNPQRGAFWKLFFDFYFYFKWFANLRRRWVECSSVDYQTSSFQNQLHQPLRGHGLRFRKFPLNGLKPA